MIEKLKPCPFCGGKARLKSSHGFNNISCENCGTEYPVSFETRKRATAVWNKRSIEDKLHEEIEKLGAENKILREALEEIVNQNDFSRYCDMSQFEQAVRDFNIQIDGIPLVRIAQSALKEISQNPLKGNEND